jgi:hypothetical protein
MAGSPWKMWGYGEKRDFILTISIDFISICQIASWSSYMRFFGRLRSCDVDVLVVEIDIF